MLNLLLLCQPLVLAPVQYGRSTEGRPLTYVQMGTGKNSTLIFSAIHGNERKTAGQVRRLEEYLKNHKDVLEGKTVTLIEVASPDGWKASTRNNARGVDLNRNFPDGWKPGTRGEKYYPGTAPLSESESKALYDLILKIKPSKVVSIHEPLACVNYDGDFAKPFARAIAAKNKMELKSDIGYPTPGSFGTFCKTRRIVNTTLELGKRSEEAEWDRIRDSLIAAIEFRVAR